MSNVDPSRRNMHKKMQKLCKIYAKTMQKLCKNERIVTIVFPFLIFRIKIQSLIKANFNIYNTVLTF